MLPNPDVLNEFTLGKFVLSNLAAKRAKQLKEGAMPLVHIESRHPLTIALAEIAAGKIESKMFAPAQPEIITEGFDVSILTDDVVPGEFGMLLPALDEVESALVETIGLEDAEPEIAAAEDGEMSLADLAGDEHEEEEDAAASDDDTLSLSDIAEEEAAQDDENSDEA
jgi:DNA-directed RNA polymerase omega subunit